MGDERKYQVRGYPAKNDPDWNLKERWIGSADDIEEAREMKGNATLIGWVTVIIFEGDSVVE
jgi:hypothetical protein